MLFKVLVGFLPCVFVLYVYCFKTWGMTKTYFPYGSANQIEFQLEIKASNLKFSHKSYFQDLFSLQAGLRKQLLPLCTLFQQNKIALFFFFYQLNINKFFFPNLLIFCVSTTQQVGIFLIYTSDTGEAGGRGLCFIHFLAPLFWKNVDTLKAVLRRAVKMTRGVRRSWFMKKDLSS